MQAQPVLALVGPVHPAVDLPVLGVAYSRLKAALHLGVVLGMNLAQEAVKGPAGNARR